MDPMPGCDIRLYITAQKQCTAVQKMRTPLKSILVYKFRPERTGFNMHATAINFPCIITLVPMAYQHSIL